MNRGLSFAVGEWYHCYNRGVDKRCIFMEERDFERFLMLLYACNSKKPIHVSSLDQKSIQGPTLNTVLEIERNGQLVDIGAYNLMDNHPHLLLREREEGGITSFMRRIGTGYTMYFNIKYERTGALFSGTFKAKHVPNEIYLERVVHYIHGNPAELCEPQWKEGVIKNESALRIFLKKYRFSSLPDYEDESRIESAIVDVQSIRDLIPRNPSLDELISQARDLYSRWDLE